MSETQAPIALGTLRQYREGWNMAASGALPTDCPYHPQSEDSNLWINGLCGFLSSPFNCEARRRYNAYRVLPKISSEELNAAKITIDEDGFDITELKYSDGSAIVLTPTLLHVTIAEGYISATCERDLEAEMLICLETARLDRIELRGCIEPLG